MSLILLPNYPVMASDSGEITIVDVEKGKKLEAVKRISKDMGISFIDLTQDFVEYFKVTSQFPFGFQNTFPGVGHLNEDGHNLVAQRLIGKIRELNLVAKE
jgi:hypothetical protein